MLQADKSNIKKKKKNGTAVGETSYSAIVS